jgi:hypothetical protein
MKKIPIIPIAPAQLRKLSSNAAAAPLTPRGLPQIHHAFRVCLCIKASGWPALFSSSAHNPFQLPRTGSSQSLLSVVLFLQFSYHFTWPVRVLYALIPPYCLVEMISKSFIALLILALTSSVNAAAITPRQAVSDGVSARDRGNPAGECQFLLGLVV